MINSETVTVLDLVEFIQFLQDQIGYGVLVCLSVVDGEDLQVRVDWPDDDWHARLKFDGLARGAASMVDLTRYVRRAYEEARASKR